MLTDCARYNDPDGECWLFWLTVQWPQWGVLTDCARYNDPDGECWLFWLTVQWPRWGVLTDCARYNDPDGECWLFWLTVQWPRWGVLTDWLCQVQWPWWGVLTVLTDCTVTPVGCVDWLTVPGTMILMESVDCFDSVQWPWWGMLIVLTDCGQVQWPWSGKLTVWLTMMARAECGLWLWPGVIKPWWGVLTAWLTVARYNEALEESLKLGVKKSLVTGVGVGFTMFCMFGSYGLAFWWVSFLPQQSLPFTWLKRTKQVSQRFHSFLCMGKCMWESIKLWISSVLQYASGDSTCKWNHVENCLQLNRGCTTVNIMCQYLSADNLALSKSNKGMGFD